MIAVDTSVVVAGLSAWHDSHEACRLVLDNKPVIVGPALLEAFSVMTRLPVPYRVSAELAAELLTVNFEDPPLVLTSAEVRDFVTNLPRRRIVGGAVYDALIAVTARQAGATLLTLDLRAARTYLAVGADARLM